MYCRGLNLDEAGVEYGCIAGVEFGGGGGVAGECVDDKFQVLAWAPDRGLHIASSSSSSSSPVSAFAIHDVLVRSFGFKT